jgi:hypothetical protein
MEERRMSELPTIDDSLASATPAQLLAQYAGILAELRRRGIVRSANSPVGDYTEHLVATALGLDLAANSTAGYDAVGRDGARYQIKGRRLTRANPSRQLGALRDLHGRHFDFLAGVLFAEDFAVARACLIPPGVVEREATYIAHTNSWRLMLRDALWAQPGVRDITDVVRDAALLGAQVNGAALFAESVRQRVPEAIRPDAAAEDTNNAPENVPVSVALGVAEPQVTYRFSRFCFKASAIEPLGPDDSFRMITLGDGVFQMTKAQFYADFPNVPLTASYREIGLYHSRKPPQKAMRYRICGP